MVTTNHPLPVRALLQFLLICLLPAVHHGELPCPVPRLVLNVQVRVLLQLQGGPAILQGRRRGRLRLEALRLPLQALQAS